MCSGQQRFVMPVEILTVALKASVLGTVEAKFKKFKHKDFAFHG